MERGIMDQEMVTSILNKLKPDGISPSCAGEYARLYSDTCARISGARYAGYQSQGWYAGMMMGSFTPGLAIYQGIDYPVSLPVGEQNRFYQVLKTGVSRLFSCQGSIMMHSLSPTRQMQQTRSGI